MLDWWQILMLALIQGVTEFLPISSSAHLILPAELFGWADQGLAFDAAVHVGSLAAVLICFRARVGDIVLGGVRSLRGDWTDGGQLAWLLVLATVPAGLAGLALSDFIEVNMRSGTVIASTTVAGAALLGVADRVGNRDRTLLEISWGVALLIGLAQALALVPGTSRSGITMTMALLLGFRRSAAAEFSFLMSIPVILLSALWMLRDLLDVDSIPWGQALVAVMVSGLSAYLCIRCFLAWIERIGFMPFVVYRMVLGAGLFSLVI